MLGNSNDNDSKELDNRDQQIDSVPHEVTMSEDHSPFAGKKLELPPLDTTNAMTTPPQTPSPSFSGTNKILSSSNYTSSSPEKPVSTLVDTTSPENIIRGIANTTSQQSTELSIEKLSITDIDDPPSNDAVPENLPVVAPAAEPTSQKFPNDKENKSPSSHHSALSSLSVDRTLGHRDSALSNKSSISYPLHLSQGHDGSRPLNTSARRRLSGSNIPSTNIINRNVQHRHSYTASVKTTSTISFPWSPPPSISRDAESISNFLQTSKPLPLPIMLGPFLRYHDLRPVSSIWTGSILVFVRSPDTSSSSSFTSSNTMYPSTPDPSAILRDPTLPESTRLKPIKIGQYGQYTAYRYDLELFMDDMIKKIWYKIGDRKFSFRIPGIREEWRWGCFSIGEMSQRIPSGIGLESQEEEWEAWKDLIGKHREQRFHGLICSAQMDHIKNSSSPSSSFSSTNNNNNTMNDTSFKSMKMNNQHSFQDLNTMTSDFLQLSSLFAIRPLADLLATVPTILLFNPTIHPCIRYLFTHHSHPEYININEIPTAFVKFIGSTTAFLGIDLQHEGGEDILSKDGWGDVWTKIGMVSTTCRHLIVWTGEPVIWPKMSLKERFLARLVNRKTGSLRGNISFSILFIIT